MRKAVIVLITATLGAGCGPGAIRPAVQGAAEQHAEQLIAAKDYRAAAEEYLQLAETHPGRLSHFQLRAVQSYLDAGDTETATSLLDGIHTRTRTDSNYRELLQARLLLLQRRPAEALSFTAEIERDAPDWLRILRHAIRAQAFEQNADVRSAITERLALSRLPATPDAAESNLDSLWSGLNAVGPDAARKFGDANEPEMQGWIELMEMNRGLAGKPEDLRSALASWGEAHPSHPAFPYITGRMLTDAERFHAVPKQLALLLPLSGQFSDAAQAIRDGFLAAWYLQQEFRPAVAIYDANSLNILDQYRKAVEAGADFVVGPLERPAVASLLQSDLQTVATLTLNRLETRQADRLDGGNPPLLPGLFQFGLAAEDEAQLAAQRAFEDGHSRALVIAAGNEWGRRLSAAFQERWRALGGTILEQVEYPTGNNDFSADTRELLNVDSSDARTAQLRQRIGRPLHGGGRLRQDADVIFMAAVPVTARQIVPQLRFFGADRIAVYASSHVYTGNPNPQFDSDMNDVRFPDMPWVLEADSAASTLEQAVVRNWSADTSAAQRLYALGADAFLLIPRLGRLAAQGGGGMRGLTGDLSLGADGVIQRKLTWAQFVDGVPRLLDPVH